MTRPELTQIERRSVHASEEAKPSPQDLVEMEARKCSLWNNTGGCMSSIKPNTKNIPGDPRPILRTKAAKVEPVTYATNNQGLLNNESGG